MTIHNAFNGQVQFDCTPPNLKTLVVRDGLERAVPESAMFLVGSQPNFVFNNLVDLLGRTRSIHFIDIGLDPDAEALQSFWAFASNTIDYRAIWNEFLMLPVVVHNEWFEAVAAVIDPRLLAPAEVQPNAPSDAELDATGTEGAKKKRVAKPT
jgi:hypothetical protein